VEFITRTVAAPASIYANGNYDPRAAAAGEPPAVPESLTSRERLLLLAWDMKGRCDSCGGRVGMIVHKWWVYRFCKKAAWRTSSRSGPGRSNRRGAKSHTCGRDSESFAPRPHGLHLGRCLRCLGS
jgi:hypothetical protein